jgi:hypothetical protein
LVKRWATLKLAGQAGRAPTFWAISVSPGNAADVGPHLTWRAHDATDN